MATLQEILDEQAVIKRDLQEMEENEETTEEKDGDLRDTLVARWEALDVKAKPLIARMERIRGITRAAEDPANLEGPDSGSAARFGNPDLVITTRRDPYDCQDLIRHEKQILMTRSELRSRAFDAIEVEDKRGNLGHDRAESATAVVENSDAGVARHMLLYGSQEYQDAFRAYTEDPEHVSEAHRAALTLSSGSVMLPFVLDQLQVA